MNDPIIVATYNVHRCVGRDNKVSIDRIVAVVAETGATLIGLQEVTVADPDDPLEGASLIEAIADRLGFHFAVGPAFPLPQGSYGVGLLSRDPIRLSNTILLPSRGGEPRVLLTAQTEGAIPVTVGVTHLSLSAKERAMQADRVAGELATVEGPLLLLGDMNDWSPVTRGFASLRRLFGGVTAVRSYPARFPLLALDRLYARPPGRIVDVASHKSRLARLASDHLPVVGRFFPS